MKCGISGSRSTLQGESMKNEDGGGMHLGIINRQGIVGDKVVDEVTQGGMENKRIKTAKVQPWGRTKSGGR